jgi:hypothetical protein
LQDVDDCPVKHIIKAAIYTWVTHTGGWRACVPEDVRASLTEFSFLQLWDWALGSDPDRSRFGRMFLMNLFNQLVVERGLSVV